jgi:prefoldin subunit 5
MSQSKVDLVKKIYGINTYSKAIDTEFKELVQPIEDIATINLTIEEFFQEYERLFFDIPIDGNINSHKYMVERSTEYIGGASIDAEKQALIEEINSLRQQLLDLNEAYLTIGNVTNIR